MFSGHLMMIISCFLVNTAWLYLAINTTDHTQAVCVTTHKGSWVKLLLCLISIVTRSSSHLVKREMNQTQGSKHCFHYRRERFGEFSRSHSGLRCLLLASQDNFNKFIAISETIVRSSRLWAATINFLLLILRFYVLFGLYVYFYLIVK